jgi:hypothetical protein
MRPGVFGFLLALPWLASANTIVMTQDAAYSYKDGGAFNAVTTDDFARAYAPVATQGGGFQTFCIEASVSFDPNTPYYYNLSTHDSVGRQLTLGAAYLYYEFATGQLAGYFTGDRSTEAGLLQAAFWGLQGGQTLAGFPDYTTDAFYMMAVTKFGSVAAATAANNNTYHVDVLQIWDSPTSHVAGVNDHQNQMVYVPDGGSDALLLGLSGAALLVAGAHLRRPAPARVRVSARR